MATTFDTPVLLTEVSDGRFRIFQGVGLPPGIPLNVPSTFPGFYKISGPLDVYHRLTPPVADVSQAEVVSWLENARKLGCVVEAGTFDGEGSRRWG